MFHELHKVGNFFHGIPSVLPDELFETLLEQKDIRIERIVSRGHTTPKDQWYDQDWDEWVMVLQGSAILTLESTEQPLEMKVGDFCLLPAHTKHRVEYTEPDMDTIWLALHIKR